MEKEYLSDWGIVGKGTQTDKTFAMLVERFSQNKDNPSDYVKKIWEKYLRMPKKQRSNSLNGNIFEALVNTVLIKEKINPIYTQTYMEFVPDIKFDIILFPKDKDKNIDVSAPICLSIKTSLRERYKQADLEGTALKQVYRRARAYLISIDENEIRKVRKKIEEKDIQGIDKCIDARTKEFDQLIEDIKNKGVGEPPEINAIKEAKELNKK